MAHIVQYGRINKVHLFDRDWPSRLNLPTLHLYRMFDLFGLYCILVCRILYQVNGLCYVHFQLYQFSLH